MEKKILKLHWFGRLRIQLITDNSEKVHCDRSFTVLFLQPKMGLLPPSSNNVQQWRVPEAHLQVFESFTFSLNGKYVEWLSEQKAVTLKKKKQAE